jgi:DNA polymerase-1
MTDVNLGSTGRILPNKNNKIALVDADTVAFAAAVSCEYSEIVDKSLCTDEEWLLIENDPGYDEEAGVLYGINIDEAVTSCINKLNVILENTGCKDFYLHFTAGRDSFRYTRIAKEYKANRLVDSQGANTRAPFGLYQIKQELCRRYPLKTKMWYECEADDAVWWLGNKYPDKYIVCAVDKDVLGATVHEAFNYYTRAGYTHPKSGNEIQPIDMKFVTAEEPEKFWYKQCLTGDAGDGIIGLSNIGPAKANKILVGCKSELDMWDAVVEAYEKAGKSMLDALLNMRMVRLDQYNPETNVLTLWDPRKLKDK